MEAGMTVRHFFDTDGHAVTEALYQHNGSACCSRVWGHLTAEQVAQVLERNRFLAAQVRYAQH
jgi:hypothetical protein